LMDWMSASLRVDGLPCSSLDLTSDQSWSSLQIFLCWQKKDKTVRFQKNRCKRYVQRPR
jgi:hypothetical protein